MQVLIIIDDLRRAGAQRVIMQEIQTLHPHAVQFAVVALARTPEPSFVGDLQRLGIQLEYINGSGIRDPRRLLMLWSTIRRIRPDLVHTHLTYANILGVLAARLAKRRVVATLHNVDTNQQRWPAVKRWLEGRLLRHCASATILVAEGCRVATLRKFGVTLERSIVVPNAVAPTTTRLPDNFDRIEKRSELSRAADELLVSTVARLDSSKGHRFLVRALPLLDKRIRLLLVGDGPEECRIRELATALGVGDRVSFLGVREDVAEILAASDLFVLPSLNEGLSQALLEAMALSIPVVATNVGGTPDVLQPGRTGWCVLPGQPLPLADAIQQALGAPTRAKTYARAAQMLVTQRFSLPVHTSQLQSLYEAVVAS